MGARFCVVDMSLTKGPARGAKPKSSINKGISAGHVGDTASGTSWTPLKITCLRRGSKAPPATSGAPQQRLKITAGLARLRPGPVVTLRDNLAVIGEAWPQKALMDRPTDGNSRREPGDQDRFAVLAAPGAHSTALAYAVLRKKAAVPSPGPPAGQSESQQVQLEGSPSRLNMPGLHPRSGNSGRTRYRSGAGRAHVESFERTWADARPWSG
jgi:hypothetical protein